MKDQNLIITKPKKKKFSHEENRFNNLSKNIEWLRDKIENEKLKFDRLLNFYLASVTPAQLIHAEFLTNFSQVLYKLLKEEKFKKNDKEKLKRLIHVNLSDVFQFKEPTEQLKSIYDEVSLVSYEEECHEKLDELKSAIELAFKWEFGMEVDLSDVQMNEESIFEKVAQLKAQYEKEKEKEKEKVSEENEKGGKKKISKSKISKREIEQELKIQKAEELQKKNIRSIYLSLAKMLHPDLEINESLKCAREEMMKKVTFAYQNKDIHTLLKLEIEIIHQQREHLNHLSDAKLKMINSSLMEQLDELKDEYSLLKQHPRYERISDFMNYEEVKGMKVMKSIINQLNSQQKEIKKDIVNLNSSNKLIFIKSILKTIQLPSQDDFDDFDDFDDYEDYDDYDVFDESESYGPLDFYELSEFEKNREILRAAKKNQRKHKAKRKKNLD